ncbi:hypothetical protein [Dyadobacter fanqingshengii]|uniref:hypothetical protein n=1 Tax=Dyadobacter fanqingshengii TaxID=2906443 RepID=UPI0020C19BA1|nr:hypothetical protein [Dyadobacter fanqingshengii]UTM21867.1 hypothetical protein NFI81_26290 [Dyadobacter fanqingshengii]
MLINPYPVRQLDTRAKKIAILAKFLHERHFMSLTKSEWKLLLSQFVKENSNFPLRFNKDGLAMPESLIAFGKAMDRFSERMLDSADPAFHIDTPDILTLSASAGFGQTVVIKLAAKK